MSYMSFCEFCKKDSIEGHDCINMAEGHKKLCYYCGAFTNSFAGFPSEWPIPLCHRDDPGRVKWHHIGCVSEKLDRLSRLQASAENLRDLLEEVRDQRDDSDTRLEIDNFFKILEEE